MASAEVDRGCYISPNLRGKSGFYCPMIIILWWYVVDVDSGREAKYIFVTRNSDFGIWLVSSGLVGTNWFNLIGLLLSRKKR